LALDSGASWCIQIEPITRAHSEKTVADMWIEMLEMPMNKGHHDSLEERSASHPLEVVPASVEIRSIELSPRKCSLNPREGLFVPNVHAKGDLRLEPIPTEVTFTNEETHQESLIEVRRRVGVFHGKHDGETVRRELPARQGRQELSGVADDC
jgi:hypothetical protein